MKPKILVIGSPLAVISQAEWVLFSSRYEVIEYAFATHDDFISSMKSGECFTIDGIMRVGINLPSGAVKIGQGWTRKFLDCFPPSLRVIVNFGHGFEQEDIEGLASRSIKFYNTTGGAEATATIGIYLIISAFRKLSIYERMVRNNEFLPALRDSAHSSRDPCGKSLGIVGMGVIGQVVAKQVAALNMQIHCLNRKSSRETLNDSKTQLPPMTLHDTLESLLQVVDCVILTCSYSKSTHHLLGNEAFFKMKPGMVVVNIARGKCIDEEALCRALETGVVSAAGLDVYENE
ncbi:hypothetical protein A1O1_03587 [Capronia coronata CBS 617.96]|uniref:D-isomer specific 2-hydroxyacid dehydrogenase NAD-binding domain-containing protein n=1 Tax=Capronia coronata CBS 617.96 TaxID=1182541 RepID=W9Z7K2_9EURO|nr:uncharacterized protein A1O1_03587 [Capronia coronata CBS 617.96]EXJ90484.1 hypothetical protein A1O1_03587 [Capronia coronata CBS 617.96]